MIGGEYVQCWNKLILNIDDRPVIPFFDPRGSSSQLNALGRRVALSIMHWNIRAMFPDHENTRLAIVQFANPVEGARKAKITFDDQVSLFDYDELDAKLAETFRMWAEVCEDRIKSAHVRAVDEDDDKEAPPFVKLWRMGS